MPTSTSGAVWGSVSCPRKLRHDKLKRPSLDPTFVLSALGYCGNMAVQRGGPRRREPAHFLDERRLILSD